MKKILALMLALVTVLSLCSCAASIATEEPAAPAATAEKDTAAPAKKDNVKFNIATDLPEGMTAGFGRADITPAPPVTIGPNTTASIVNDPLYASCTVISDGETVAVLIHMDVKSIYSSFLRMATNRLNKDYGIPAENVILNATHSHNSPTSLTNDTNWLKVLLNGISSATGDALLDLAPAEAYIGYGDTTGFGFVRRYLLSNGKYKCNPSRDEGAIEHESEADPELRTIRFERGDKKDILLVNWQCHAAHGRSSHPKWISSDFIYGLRTGVEKDMDVHLSYHNGASGNLNFTNVTGPQKANYEVAGVELVDIVKQAVAAEEKVELGKIKSATTKVTVNVIQDSQERIKGAKAYNNAAESEKPAVLAQYGLISSYEVSAILTRQSYGGPTKDIALFAISCGDLAFSTSPFEQFDSDGKAVRDASPFKMTFSCAYSNGHYGYLPSTLAYPNGSYEVYTTYFEMGTSDQIVEGQISLLNQLYSAS